MPQSAFINPITLPANLNAAEQKFVRCMAKGIRCVINTTRPNPDEVIDKGINANVIRADVIRFFVWGGSKRHAIAGNIISLEGAHISDRLNLLLVSSPYTLALMHCHFHDSISMMHAQFRVLNLSGSYLPQGLDGDGMHIDGGLFMRNKFSAKGEVLLVGADIGGDMDCDDSEFNNEKGRSLVADGIKVGGSFFMRNKFIAKGTVCLLGANVGGDVDCDRGKFINKKGKALFADGIKVGGNFSMKNNFTAEGEVRLLGANIGGSWQCRGAIIKNERSKALVADGTQVGGNLSMINIFAKGAVSLVGAHIGGNVYCGGGVFNNEKGKADFIFGRKVALAAQEVKVGSSLFLNSRFVAKGAVVLHNAEIGDNVLCRGFFINKEEKALIIDGASISGNLSLQRVVILGEVRLIRANIGGKLLFGGKIFGDVIAASATIGNTLLWRIIDGSGQCNLSFVSADIFDYNEKSLREIKFSLNGFSYKQLVRRRSVKSLLDWLQSSPDKKFFAPQPFEQAAKVLFAMGHNNDAREILLEKERRLTEQKRWWQKPWRWLWGASVGYGYKPGMALIWTVLFVAMGAWIFDHADESHRIVPHQPVVLRMLRDDNVMKNKPNCAGIQRPTDVVECLLPEYPKFHALTYSLDVFIPAFALHLESHWYPQPKEGDAGWKLIYLRVWYWIEIIAGWILTSLLVLTITGLLKPRQSSLE